MSERVIADLRSDTVTQPSPEMRRVIAEAVVGDDVLGDDPTVLKLQEKAAALLGKEAAIYTPSGTMANQIAIRAHTSHGDEVICHRDSHAFYYESGAPAALSGVSANFLYGERGQFTADDVERAWRPPNSHFAPSRLIIIENTHNRGGGSVWDISRIEKIAALAGDRDLAMHLDGARLMNACVAKNLEPTAYTRFFDTVSVCFSKGLGAPVGSVLAGTKEVISRAHRFRKMFGGGMRQSGLLAAAAIHALDNNVDRLVDDHRNAKTLARALVDLPGVSIDLDAVETNILFFDLHESFGTAAKVCERLREAGVLMLAESPQRVRAVTHLDVSAEQIDQAVGIIKRVLQRQRDS